MQVPFDIADPDVAQAFARHPDKLKQALLRLRGLILEVAAEAAPQSTLIETLKWGQPSYLTQKPKAGTTVRIDADGSHRGGYALYVPCSTTLVAQWRDQYPQLTFGGDRSVHFQLGESLPEAAVRHCVAMAMTYHTHKAATRPLPGRASSEI